MHTSGAELLESSASAISRRASDLPLREPQKQDLAPFRLPTTPPVSPYQQGGRLRSDWVAAFDRNRWPPSVGIGGRFASDSAGKVVTLFVPNIGWELYQQILRASRVAAIREKARIETA